MRSEQDGIFVPYRVIFITVIVSIFINIFFLLMGILIGKDDLKWSEQQTTASETPVETRLRDNRNNDEEAKRERIERELATFNDSEERQEPVDITHLEDNSQVDVGLPPEEPPVVETQSETMPETRKPKPESKPKPRETQPAGAESFWIQLSATSDKKKATAFRDQVKKSGYPAVLLEESGMYKVQVGPFSSRKDAEADRKKLNSAFKVNSWIRTR